MIKRTIASLTASLLLLLAGRAAFGQATNAPDTNAPAAAAPAAAAPNFDPGGGNTGTIGDLGGSGGSYSYPTFQVSAPAELSADDKKDTNKVAAYTDAKKAFDDYTAQAKAEPLAVKMADAVGHNRISINFVWTLVTGFLVMFMQAGFALVETGLCRAKNASHTMTMNMLIYPLGMLGFWVCGFAFMFGGVGALGGGTLGSCSSLNHEWTWHLFGHDWGIIGLKGFFLSWDTYDVGVFCLFLFQMVFMDTTATIPTGAAAERWKFSAFCLYGCFIGTIMYPVFGNWVWGGGWLSQMGTNWGLGHGHVDFAGSSVVHMQGGVIGLIFAWLLGPRIGKYNKDGSANPMPPHNIPYAILGTFILAFGWFGFNPGSTLAGTDLRIAVVATNTMLASATGLHGSGSLDVVGSHQETGSEHGLQRNAGRLGRHYLPLRLCRTRAAPALWAWWPGFWWSNPCFSLTGSALTILSARFPCMALAALGVVFRWDFLAMARTARAGIMRTGSRCPTALTK